MNKRAVITGHTRGIGQRLSNHLSEMGWDISGFSRENGADLQTADAQQRVLAACEGATLFINNAHVGFAQTNLLFMVFEIWRDRPQNMIINIGVDNVPATDWQVVYRAYPVEKVALHAAANELHNESRRCRITNLCLGHMETESNAAFLGKKLDLGELVRVVDWILTSPPGTEIKTLTLAPI